MGIDTGDHGCQPYHGHVHSYQSHYGAPSAYPSKAGGARQQPIDLTADSPPPKKRSTKRKAIAEEHHYDEEQPIKKRKSEAKYGEEQQYDEEQPTKKQKSKAKDEEKRLRRWRPKAPVSYGEIRERALTHRMFVIDRERHAPENEHSHPTEVVTMAGTTGNVYHVTVDKVPQCDCPHARKGNQCKHIVYVLSRILRVPADLEYQLAFITPELRDIFAKAPPLPSQTADESGKDGKRKPLEGECPICAEDFEPEDSREKVVYCKAACGNNIHKSCFDQWAATKRGAGVTCPLCRTPWESGDEGDIKKVATNGGVNTEGYVNVASQLGLSGRRDYSTYNEYWVRQQMRNGNVDYEAGWGF